MPLGLSDIPLPYRDELHFGYFGRLQTYWLSRTANALNRHVRGDTKGYASSDLLRCSEEQIGHLSEEGVDGDDLLWNHTLLPYYLAFRTTDERLRILRRIRAGTLVGLNFLTGFAASRVKRPRFFRYCPHCWRSEEAELGEVYLKRLLQLPGVVVCPEHGDALCETTVLYRPLASRAYWHFTPSDAMPNPVFRPASDDEEQLARLVALDSRRLLQQSDSALPKGEYCLHADYHRALQHLGLASRNIHPIELETAFLDMYSMRFLDKLGLGFEPGRETNWLRCLVRKQTRHAHPLEHLLFRRFVEHHLGSNCWLAMEAEHWPCLSPLHPHPGKAEVSVVYLHYDSERDSWEGGFQCTCGFRYSGGGSGYPSAAGLHLHRVIAHSPLLRQRVQELARDGSSVSAIAQQVGVHRKTVQEWLELEANRKVPRSTVTLERDRKAWLALLDLHPLAALKDLRKQAPALFARLYNHDTAWLKQVPLIHEHPRPAAHEAYWNHRDQTLALQVTSLVNEIRLRKPAVRVTVSRIGRELGLLNLFRSKLAHLPSVAEALAGSVETVEAFQLRRLELALRDAQACVSRRALMRSAGLSHQTMRPRVAQAIESLFSGEATP